MAVDDHFHEGTGDIKIAFFLNLAFTMLEVVGGLLTNSVAILSDALHDLGDSVSLGLSWFLSRYAEREGDERFSYGYRRFSLLGALLNAVILIVGSVFILSEAIPRLLAPQQAYAPGMALLAVVGITVNGLAVLRLRGGQSLNVRRRLRQTAALFLQAVPETVDIEYVEEQLLDIDGVLSTHHTHAWSLDGEHHVLTTHIVVDGDATKAEIVDAKCRVRALLNGTNFAHVTVEAEYEDESCDMRAAKDTRPGGHDHNSQ